MGTHFSLLVAADTARSAELEAAAAAAWERLAELDSILSDWNSDSELMRACARSQDSAPTGPVPVSADLWRVLVHAQQVAAASDGAFDVTVGAYTRLWRRAARQNEEPDPERMQAAAAAVGWRKLRLHPETQSVEFLVPAMRLDLGGIAKGYALDELLALLAARGFANAIVEGGGDLALGPAPPRGSAWQVAVRTGVEGAETLHLRLAAAGVATSGAAFRYRITADGTRESHLLDPGTGAGLRSGLTVTVVAPTAMQADALASAVSVLGVESGLALVTATDGAEALLRWREAGGEISARSPGFAAIMEPPRSPRATFGESLRAPRP